MSSDEIGRIERQLGALTSAVNSFHATIGERMARQETLMENLQLQTQRMDDRLSTVAQHGCAHYPEHAETKVEVKDLNGRVSTLEGDKRAVLGAAAGAGIVTGGVGAWLAKLIGGAS